MAQVATIGTIMTETITTTVAAVALIITTRIMIMGATQTTMVVILGHNRLKEMVRFIVALVSSKKKAVASVASSEVSLAASSSFWLLQAHLKLIKLRSARRKRTAMAASSISRRIRRRPIRVVCLFRIL